MWAYERDAFRIRYLAPLRVFHLLHHLIFRGAQWRRGAGTLVDIFTSVTLLSASVLRISLDTELLESMGVAPPFTARSQLGWYVGEVARANPPNASHTTLGEARDIGAMGDTGICNWSPHYEVLRVLFALAAILLISKFFEAFFLSKHSKSGVLLLCASRMLQKMGQTWLPPMMLVTCAFGFGLNILAPEEYTLYDLGEVRAGADYMGYASGHRWSWLSWLDSSRFNLNLAVDGTFFAPFWGIFDLHYSPGDLAAMESASIMTPFFVWIFLLVSLVLFVNLLIAMFNEQFTEVMAKADDNVRMAKVRHVRHYIEMYSVPPPFNVPAVLLYKAFSFCRNLIHYVYLTTCRDCGDKSGRQDSMKSRDSFSPYGNDSFSQGGRKARSQSARLRVGSLATTLMTLITQNGNI